MQDPMAMHERNSLEEIPQYPNSIPLVHPAPLLHHPQQMASRTILQNEIHTRLIMEVAVQFDDVGVLQVHLDLYLLNERLAKVLLV